ncbi:hypothetical protein Dsin_005207 [Dipteronia sinensis]|uniref:Uncharacterized protein n=1 Tax=Dipteronia sinensis TaxID=43782 RepID=A0AAE0AX15_9ROSI|nr:hypothetical protein Dsin_005207 [Dipteronia sinensis]
MSSGFALLSIAGASKKLWFCNFSLFITLFFFFNTCKQFWSPQLLHRNIQRFSTFSMQSRSKVYVVSAYLICFPQFTVFFFIPEMGFRFSILFMFLILLCRDSFWGECIENCLRYNLFYLILGLKGFRVLNIL